MKILSRCWRTRAACAFHNYVNSPPELFEVSNFEPICLFLRLQRQSIHPAMTHHHIFLTHLISYNRNRANMPLAIKIVGV